MPASGKNHGVREAVLLAMIFTCLRKNSVDLANGFRPKKSPRPVVRRAGSWECPVFWCYANSRMYRVSATVFVGLKFTLLDIGHPAVKRTPGTMTRVQFLTVYLIWGEFGAFCGTVAEFRQIWRGLARGCRGQSQRTSPRKM